MSPLDDATKDDLAIRNLVARFADVCTVDDGDGFRALWAPDGVWEVSDPFPARAAGVDSIVTLYHQLRSPHATFVQMPHSGVVRIDGDTARGRWVMQEVGRNPATGLNYNNFGLYMDTLVRTGGDWCFTRRSYQYLWVDVTTPIPGQSIPVPDHAFRFV